MKEENDEVTSSDETFGHEILAIPVFESDEEWLATGIFIMFLSQIYNVLFVFCFLLFGFYLFGLLRTTYRRSCFLSCVFCPVRSSIISSRVTKHEKTSHDAQKVKNVKSQKTKNRKQRTHCRSGFKIFATCAR